MLTRKKSSSEIEIMRNAGKILAESLLYIESETKPGISTRFLDEKVRQFFHQKQVAPAFLGYHGFEGAICISVNDAIIHGVPSEKIIIQDGDIVSLDCGIISEGLYVDSAITFGVGNISEENRLLVERTKKALYKGISVLKNGIYTGDFGYAVEQYISQFSYGLVREYAGHGIGEELHQDPSIPNYGVKHSGDKLETGMTIAVEPMVMLGDEGIYVDSDDGWTVYTEDGKCSAHWEHTVLITDKGAEILTVL